MMSKTKNKIQKKIWKSLNLKTQVMEQSSTVIQNHGITFQLSGDSVIGIIAYKLILSKSTMFSKEVTFFICVWVKL